MLRIDVTLRPDPAPPLTKEAILQALESHQRYIDEKPGMLLASLLPYHEEALNELAIAHLKLNHDVTREEVMSALHEHELIHYRYD